MTTFFTSIYKDPRLIYDRIFYPNSLEPKKVLQPDSTTTPLVVGKSNEVAFSKLCGLNLDGTSFQVNPMDAQVTLLSKNELPDYYWVNVAWLVEQAIRGILYCTFFVPYFDLLPKLNQPKESTITLPATYLKTLKENDKVIINTASGPVTYTLKGAEKLAIIEKNLQKAKDEKRDIYPAAQDRPAGSVFLGDYLLSKNYLNMESNDDDAMMMNMRSGNPNMTPKRNGPANVPKTPSITPGFLFEEKTGENKPILGVDFNSYTEKLTATEEDGTITVQLPADWEGWDVENIMRIIVDDGIVWLGLDGEKNHYQYIHVDPRIKGDMPNTGVKGNMFQYNVSAPTEQN